METSLCCALLTNIWQEPEVNIVFALLYITFPLWLPLTLTFIFCLWQFNYIYPRHVHILYLSFWGFCQDSCVCDLLSLVEFGKFSAISPCICSLLPSRGSHCMCIWTVFYCPLALAAFSLLRYMVLFVFVFGCVPCYSECSVSFFSCFQSAGERFFLFAFLHLCINVYVHMWGLVWGPGESLQESSLSHHHVDPRN